MGAGTAEARSHDPVERVGHSSLDWAFAQERTSLHLIVRLVTHTYLAAAPGRRARSRWVTPLWIASVTADIASAAYLHRSGKERVWWRAAMEITDTSAWAMHGLSGRIDSGAVISMTPYALEAAFRRGATGAAETAGVAAIVLAVQRVVGRPAHMMAFRWTALAVAGGGLLRWFHTDHENRVLRQHDLELEARCDRASLAGEMFVSAGVDTVVDRLGKLQGRVTDEVTHLILAMRDRRQLVGELHSDNSVQFLAVAARRWLFGLPERFPLHGVDGVDMPTNDGLLLLTPTQAHRLHEVLDEHRQDEGTVFVKLRGTAEPRRHPPGNRVKLVVADRPVTLPAEATRLGSGTRSYDPSGLAFVLAAAWNMNHMVATGPAVPLVVAAPVAGACGAVGWYFIARARRGEPIDPQDAAWCAIVLSAAGGWPASVAVRNRLQPDGIQNFPVAGSLTHTVLLLAYQWESLARSRVRLVTVAGAVAAIGYFLTPRPRSPSHLLAQLIWCAAAIMPPVTVRRSIDASTAEIVDALAADDSRKERDAFRRAVGSWIHRLEEIERTASASAALDDETARELAAAKDALAELRRRAADPAVGVTDRTLPPRPRTTTPMHSVDGLDHAIATAARLGDAMVFDVENTLVGYRASSSERHAAIIDAARRAADAGLACVVFASNSRMTIPPVHVDGIEVHIVTSAGKPHVHRSPLLDIADRLVGATVCGDQLATDGLLARRLGGAYVVIRREGPPEPLWPRCMRWAGERFLKHLFKEQPAPLSSEPATDDPAAGRS